MSVTSAELCEIGDRFGQEGVDQGGIFFGLLFHQEVTGVLEQLEPNGTRDVAIEALAPLRSEVRVICRGGPDGALGMAREVSQRARDFFDYFGIMSWCSRSRSYR